MFDDGTVLFLANYVYINSRAMIFFFWSAHTELFNFAAVPPTQSRRLWLSSSLSLVVVLVVMC